MLHGIKCDYKPIKNTSTTNFGVITVFLVMLFLRISVNGVLLFQIHVQIHLCTITVLYAIPTKYNCKHLHLIPLSTLTHFLCFILRINMELTTHMKLFILHDSKRNQIKWEYVYCVYVNPVFPPPSHLTSHKNFKKLTHGTEKLTKRSAVFA